MADRAGRRRPAPLGEGERGEEREQGQPRPGRGRHAGEEALRVGRLRPQRLAGLGDGGGVEAREPQRRAHGEQDAGDVAQRAYPLQRPQVEQDRRRDAEAQEVGQAVELGAEAARALEQPRDAPVQPVDDGGDHDEGRGLRPAPFQPEADGDEAGAQADQREQVRDQPVEGRAALARPGPPAQAAEPAAQPVFGAAQGAAVPSSARIVSPPIMVWPTRTSGSTPSGR